MGQGLPYPICCVTLEWSLPVSESWVLSWEKSQA